MRAGINLSSASSTRSKIQPGSINTLAGYIYVDAVLNRLKVSNLCIHEFHRVPQRSWNLHWIPIH